MKINWQKSIREKQKQVTMNGEYNGQLATADAGLTCSKHGLAHFAFLQCCKLVEVGGVGIGRLIAFYMSASNSLHAGILFVPHGIYSHHYQNTCKILRSIFPSISNYVLKYSKQATLLLIFYDKLTGSSFDCNVPDSLITEYLIRQLLIKIKSIISTY